MTTHFGYTSYRACGLLDQVSIARSIATLTSGELVYERERLVCRHVEALGNARG